MPRGRPHKCPYDGCGSTNTVSKGARITISMGTRKIRLCKGCGRKFTPKNQKAEQFEEIQTESMSMVESENPVPADIGNLESTEMQIPEL